MLPIFDVIQREGSVSNDEMYRVFNMGLGMVAVCNENNLSQSGIQSTGDDQRESVFVGAKDGTVRRIQIKSGQTLVWCFDMGEGDACN